MSSQSKADILKHLQTDILRMEGFKVLRHGSLDLGLGPMRDSFPQGSFPVGAIHEFLTTRKENMAATSGFLAGLLSALMGNQGATLWISTSRTLFPPALKSYGLAPERFIFLDLEREKDVLWAMDEALKCSALAAVVGEMKEIDFTASRRLQLAVEKSKVTGFILRHHSRSLGTTACVSRWKVVSLPSIIEGEMPGVGFPQWRVELLRMRNGKPGKWELQWVKGRFMPVTHFQTGISLQQQKAG